MTLEEKRHQADTLQIKAHLFNGLHVEDAVRYLKLSGLSDGEASMLWGVDRFYRYSLLELEDFIDLRIEERASGVARSDTERSE